MVKVTTSLKLDDLVYKKFRIKCIEKNMEYSKAMEEAMHEWIVRK